MLNNHEACSTASIEYKYVMYLILNMLVHPLQSLHYIHKRSYPQENCYSGHSHHMPHHQSKYQRLQNYTIKLVIFESFAGRTKLNWIIKNTSQIPIIINYWLLGTCIHQIIEM